MQLEKYKRAKKSFNEAKKIDPNKIDKKKILYYKGIALCKGHYSEKGFNSFEKYIKEQYENEDEGWVSIGIVLKNRKHYLNAISAFDKALAINPNNHDALYNKGLATGLGAR